MCTAATTGAQTTVHRHLGCFMFDPTAVSSHFDASHPLWKRRWEQQVQAQQGRNSRQQGSRRYTSWASGVFFLFVFFLLYSFYFYFLYSKMLPLNLHHHGTTSIYNALVSYFLLFLFFSTTNFFYLGWLWAQPTRLVLFRPHINTITYLS